MKVIKAAVLGYCMGVKRAVESAENALKDAFDENDGSPKKVYTLGPLIHNPTVLKSLQDRGVTILDEDGLNSLDQNSVVVIRAHGTTPEILEKLRKTGATVVDSTCPRVHLSQKKAFEFAQKGYTVVIAGDRNHGEVTSIQGYAGENNVVLENVREAEECNLSGKVLFLSQTTFSPSLFKEMEIVLRKKNLELQVFNSICNATMERQTALRDLKGKVDAVVVIGGRNSANTKRLYEIASSICPKAALIETPGEIPQDILCEKSVGITAGASTPDSVIQQVENILMNLIAD